MSGPRSFRGIETEAFMEQKLTDAINSFSQKFSRFKKSGKTERVTEPTPDRRLQQQIRESGERFKMSVVQTYKIYRSPFEALGKDSTRAQSIDRDEQLLLKAWELYAGMLDFAKEKSDEQTFVSRVEVKSPLAQKASYTDGGQFIYLMMWLYFEKNCQTYMPFFEEDGESVRLNFCPAEKFEFDNHDREIFELVKTEFYS